MNYSDDDDADGFDSLLESDTEIKKKHSKVKPAAHPIVVLDQPTALSPTQHRTNSPAEPPKSILKTSEVPPDTLGGDFSVNYASNKSSTNKGGGIAFDTKDSNRNDKFDKDYTSTGVTSRDNFNSLLGIGKQSGGGSTLTNSKNNKTRQSNSADPMSFLFEDDDDKNDAERVATYGSSKTDNAANKITAIGDNGDDFTSFLFDHKKSEVPSPNAPSPLQTMKSTFSTDQMSQQQSHSTSISKELQQQQQKPQDVTNRFLRAELLETTRDQKEEQKSSFANRSKQPDSKTFKANTDWQDFLSTDIRPSKLNGKTDNNLSSNASLDTMQHNFYPAPTLPPNAAASTHSNQYASVAPAESLKSSAVMLKSAAQATNNTISSQSQSQTQLLQTENAHLRELLEMTKKYQEEEKTQMTQLFESKSKLSEENWLRIESRYKVEIDELTKANEEKSRMMQQMQIEKSKQLADKVEQIEREKRAELERMSHEHKMELDSVRKEQHDKLEQMRKMSRHENAIISESQPVAHQLRNLIEEVSTGQRDFAEIKSQLTHHLSKSAADRTEEARARDEELANLQQRMRREQTQNSEEKTRLYEMVGKLEVQLRESNSRISDSLWNLKQEESKLEAQRNVFEEEKRQFHEKCTRDETRIKQERDSLLEDQKKLLERQFEEKNAAISKQDQLMQESKRATEAYNEQITELRQKETELNTLREKLFTKQSQQKQLESELNRRENAVKSAEQEIDKKKRDWSVEEQQIAATRKDLADRESSIQQAVRAAAEREENANRTLAQSQRLASENKQRLAEIQTRLELIRSAEQSVAHDKILISKQKAEIATTGESGIVRGLAGGGSRTVSGLSQHHQMANSRMSGVNLSSDTGFFEHQDVMNTMQMSSSLAQEMEQSRIIESLRIAASEDEHFLQKEQDFLKNIRFNSFANY